MDAAARICTGRSYGMIKAVPRVGRLPKLLCQDGECLLHLGAENVKAIAQNVAAIKHTLHAAECFKIIAVVVLAKRSRKERERVSKRSTDKK